ncbi:hypothetical protein Tco_0350163, partial [Tanacetum coccineum]
GYFERYIELKKIIALLRLLIGSSLGRKVHSSEVEMVKFDTMFDYYCMKEVGCRYLPANQVVLGIVVAFLELL